MIYNSSKMSINNADKINARKAALDYIKKEFGADSIMSLGHNNKIIDIEAISTGSLALDMALGIGGLPVGRICEIYGPESSGKTTIALSVIAQAHKKDPNAYCAIIDTEHALDPVYAKRLGVDLERMLISQPKSAEEALEIMDKLVRSGGFEVVILDSVAALVPQAELEGEMGDSHMGLQARLMSQALRKLTASIAKSKTLVIFINQIRQKIGIMFGNPETTTGGNALKFYASVRLDIRRTGTVKDKEKPIGNEVKVKVVKNKVGTPFQSADLFIVFGEGIDRKSEIIELATSAGILEKAGSWYSMDGQKIGQGKDSVKAFLSDKPDLCDQLEKRIKSNLKDNLLISPDAVAAEKALAAAANEEELLIAEDNTDILEEKA